MPRFYDVVTVLSVVLSQHTFGGSFEAVPKSTEPERDGKKERGLKYHETLTK